MSKDMDLTVGRVGQSDRSAPWAAGIAALSSLLLGLAAGRIAYEFLFPRALWLGRPLPALLIGGLAAILGWQLWRRLAQTLGQHQESAGELTSPAGRPPAPWTAVIPYLPLLINLGFLFDPTVDLSRSRFLFFCSIWLGALFLARLSARPAVWRWLSFVLLAGFLLPVYLATMGQTVGTADTFEFQVVAPKLGIVHPTGYPLYLLLAKGFTYLPLGSVAWRINLATAVFGVIAASLLFILGWRLTGRSLAALLAAVLLGLTPTFWSQAVEAEVYTLHALIVSAALLLMREVGDYKIDARLWENRQTAPPPEPVVNGGPHLPAAGEVPRTQSSFYSAVLLAAVLGLGLTNHLTTVILLPAALLSLFFAARSGRLTLPYTRLRSLLLLIGAFILPLLLYAYLPIRWSAVNGEAMGLARFIDWVIGGRFQGALQLDAWLNDPARTDIVGRLFSGDWPGVWTALLILVGGAYLFLWQWRYALILLLTWLGYVFYALNYYVPDLAVFLIPAQMIVALWWLVGIAAGLDLVVPLSQGKRAYLVEAVFLLAALLPLWAVVAGQTLAAVDRSGDDGRTQWGRAVLDLPLPEGSAILADSDKFPPLYYLQQAEGQRPDLDIMVLPDESAYRAELNARLAAGQRVYLARFLPGLEGLYHLRSLGPLTEASTAAVTDLPPGAEVVDLTLGPLKLLAYNLEPISPFNPEQAAVTFYWQAETHLDQVLQVYTRWASDDPAGAISSQHPANNTYPTVAWKPGEIVADYHALPRPGDGRPASLQVALAAAYTPPAELTWQTVTTTLMETAGPMPPGQTLRAQLGPLTLDGLVVPQQIRPQDNLPVRLSGYAPSPEPFSLALLPSGAELTSSARQSDWQSVQPLPLPQSPIPSPRSLIPFIWSSQLETGLPPGDYDLVAAYPDQSAICGWLARRTTGCRLAQVEVNAVALPVGATNFDDQLGLLSVDLPQMALQPGGRLPLILTWQALADIDEDYTVFVQVLDAEERIVGQVDSWPVQGTYPTGSWQAGEIIVDPYLVQLAEDLPPGPYKLYVGWYLLETLRRLPVIGDNGLVVDDKVVFSGLSVQARSGS